MLANLKTHVRSLKREAIAIYFAARDPRTPWYVKALIFFVVAHTFSAIDLIPDFIPVLGYLDDLIITPLGIALAIRLIPAEVLTEARLRAPDSRVEGSVASLGGFLVVLTWIIGVAIIIYLVLFLQS